MRCAVALLLSLAATPAFALNVVLPGDAELLLEESTPTGAYTLPVGPWAGDTLPARRIAGEVTRQVWRVPGSREIQLVDTLREGIESRGLTLVLDCEARDCGGFDFRFATEVLPPPEMQVDLATFHFLAAEGPGPEAVGILASPGGDATFVQIITVSPAGIDPPAVEPETISGSVAGDIGAALEGSGRAVLSGLEFPSGSSQLGSGDYASLASLAAWLAADPSRRVALVGHTDAQGGLEGNITLSRRRAASVMERLAVQHDVPRRQMQAEGVGWLAPVASNLTAAGREANRRVEVVLVDRE